MFDSPNARLGIVTTGKSYLDVLQALEYLGLDRHACEDIGIRVYKDGMSWPLEPEGIRQFAHGLQRPTHRSEAHTSELQSIMRTSYTVFCLKTNKTKHNPK